MEEIRKGGELERISGCGGAVGFPKKKRRSDAVIKWVVWGVALSLAVALAFAFAGGNGGNGFWNKLCGLAFGGGFVFDDDEEQSNGTTVGESSVEETTADTESSSEEQSLESEPFDEIETVSDGDMIITVLDLSEAEKGDGYVLNYSDRTYDAEGLLEMGFHAEYYPGSSAPTVLILHTHTSEGYADLDPENQAAVLTSSVVAVGDVLATELNLSGIPTVHCTVIHDEEGDAYENAAETIEMMTRIYPTIEYIIDLHRMELTDEGGNVVKTCSADQVAQVRITVSTEGVLSRGTLSLALCLRKKLNSDDARLCMPIILTDSEYNAASALYYVKLDVGSRGNSSEEARAAAIRFAEAFADIVID